MTEPPWIVEARKYLGLDEGPGAEDNPVVVRMYADCGHPEVKHDSVPWCAAFVGAVLKRVGIKGTNSLLALSYKDWGEHIAKPIYGCIGIKVRKGGGHVCFILGETPISYLALGGNQGDRVCIEAIEKKNFVAFRWPKGIPFTTHSMLASVPALKHNLTEA